MRKLSIVGWACGRAVNRRYFGVGSGTGERNSMSRPKHARRPTVGLLTLLVAGLIFAPLALAAAGDFDSSFDGDGKVITDFGKNEYAHGMAIQRDGRIVVVGGDTELDPPRYYRDFVLARYLGD